MDLSLVIQLIAGVVGGNVAGSLVRTVDLGTVGNSIAGLVGGSLGGQILANSIGPAGAGASVDVGTMVTDIAGGGIGGGAVMILIGIVQRLFSRENQPM